MKKYKIVVYEQVNCSKCNNGTMEEIANIREFSNLSVYTVIREIYEDWVDSSIRVTIEEV